VRTGTAPLARDVPAPRMARRGVFVTITERGELRGCIGRLVPDGPVQWLTGAMALHAAVDDPRFGPVRPDELGRLHLEVSLLTPLRRVASPEQIVLGRDGVVLVKSGKSAVFLPEIAAQQGWTRDQLLDNLCLKAGLPADAWRSGATLAVFQTTVFQE
jgi:AmmeMemoRadiSam system protein A